MNEPSFIVKLIKDLKWFGYMIDFLNLILFMSNEYKRYDII
jgi:hypothetical protein